MRHVRWSLSSCTIIALGLSGACAQDVPPTQLESDETGVTSSALCSKADPSSCTDACADARGSITAAPSTIALGQSSTLQWTTSLPPGCVTRITVGGTAASASGTRVVSPAGTTSYALRAGGTTLGTATVNVVLPPPISDRLFYFRGLGNRCWDFGGEAWWQSGAPVFLYSCNGSIAQQVRVKEIDATHDVELRVQNFCLGVKGGRVVAGQPLELQTCDRKSSAQRFALYGDAVLMGTQASELKVARDFVIESQGERTAERTPLVVGPRDANDAEYYRTVAVDGSGAAPTSGFVTVSNEATLDWAIGLGWGTVIQVDDRQSLVVSSPTWKRLRAGTTLRGYRKYAYQGPEISFPGKPVDGQDVFHVEEGNVRITGLRLRGPSRSTDGSLPYYHAITAVDGYDVLVDHIDGSDWTGAVVNIIGQDGSQIIQQCFIDPAQYPPYPRPTPVRVVGSFLHHNVRDGGGYGVGIGDGAFPLVRGNVFYMNRHSVSSDGRRTTGYVAHDNFVLSSEPDYGTWPNSNYEQEFDKHGTLDPPHWRGGLSDDYVDFGWNTFLATNTINIDERGTPCRFTAIHDSVFLQGSGGALESLSTDPSKLSRYANQFNASNPTDDLAVGDFDGDGLDDVFVGTGTGWWFSSSGRAEWRLLSRKIERASALRFGDFDGDGRTDVLALNGSLVQVSWAGVSEWETINSIGFPLSDLAIGDFDGDRKADIFLATGSDFYYAPGGRTWQYFASSNQRTSALRFGDFDADHKTDVFAVVGTEWQMVRGGTSAWTTLRSALTSNTNGLVVADFDGDGYADVARQSGGAWQYAARGWGGFVTLRSTSDSLADRPIGRFDGDAKADVLLWNGRQLSLASGARDPLIAYSRQDVR
ncbi:hypothetical protein BH11MYX4_BH11MYX4_26250 [soil metagenome]